MTFLWLSIAVFHLFSVMFMGWCLLRLFRSLRRYRFEENPHTLLFGFLKIEHVMFLYVFFVALYIAATTLFIYFLAV